MNRLPPAESLPAPINLDSLSEGFQILREFIVYSNLNFVKLCQDFDIYETRVLSKDAFRNSLKASPLYFTPQNIEQIYNDAPKNSRNDVLYQELNKWIQVSRISPMKFF